MAGAGRPRLGRRDAKLRGVCLQWDLVGTALFKMVDRRRKEDKRNR